MSANAVTRTRDATIAFLAMYGALPVAVERGIAKFLRQERLPVAVAAPVVAPVATRVTAPVYAAPVAVAEHIFDRIHVI